MIIIYALAILGPMNLDFLEFRILEFFSESTTAKKGEWADIFASIIHENMCC